MSHLLNLTKCPVREYFCFFAHFLIRIARSGNFLFTLLLDLNLLGY